MIREKKTAPAKSVVSVGNFDGIHCGHRLLIQTVMDRAAHLEATPAIVTFEPHTRAVLHPHTPITILTTSEEKKFLLQEIGIEHVIFLEFTQNVASMQPEQFVKKILIERLNAVEWVMGENHTFGQQKGGSKNFLHKGPGIKHFNIFAVSLERSDSDVVSSTQIRSLILKGAVSRALQMLDSPYLVMASRISGMHVGSSIGFPTMNFRLPPSDKVIPPAGVYAATSGSGKQELRGALYIGNCPTFGNREYHMEFHAISENGPYPQDGETVPLWVHDFLREDRRFAGENELSMQIKKDMDSIKGYFGNRKE